MYCERCGEPLGELDIAVEVELDPAVDGVRDFVIGKDCAQEITEEVEF